MRAELLGQCLSAEFALERAMADLPVGARAEGEQQLRLVKQLQRQIGHASPTALGAMRAEIAAAITLAQTTIDQSRTAAQAETVIMLAEAASASREQVKAAMEAMHRFDPYLHFDSPEEQEAYRHREAERRADIAAEQAKGTPQGDLNAAGGTVGQMVDAKAHGAGDSPEFQRRWDALADSTQKLRAQLIREGKDVTQFDTRLREDLREIMRAKGIPDTQINILLAAHANNPLDAARAFVSEEDVSRIEAKRNIQAEAALSSNTPLALPATASLSQPAIALMASDAMAEFRALGVIAGEHDTSASPSHGVTAAVQPSSNQAIGLRS